MKSSIVFIFLMTFILGICCDVVSADKVDLSKLNGFKVIKGVDNKANQILYQAGAFLKAAKTFKFKAIISKDTVLYDGVRVELNGECDVLVQRPNKFKAIFKGDEKSRQTYFDGNILSLYSLTKNFYITKKIPGTIDNVIDTIFEKFGFSVPLADLVYSDLYADLVENIKSGSFVGQHTMNGVLCNHLSFQQELIDWQVWIEIGDKPFVRKILISYKNKDGAPEYEAELTNWEINMPVNDDDFSFTPPKGVEQIEFLPVKILYGEKDSSKSEVE